MTVSRTGDPEAERDVIQQNGDGSEFGQNVLTVMYW